MIVYEIDITVHVELCGSDGKMWIRISALNLRLWLMFDFGKMQVVNLVAWIGIKRNGMRVIAS